MSKIRRFQLLSVLALGIASLSVEPHVASAAMDCSFCIESCNVDAEHECEDHGCAPNGPVCQSNACPVGQALIECRPV